MKAFLHMPYHVQPIAYSIDPFLLSKALSSVAKSYKATSSQSRVILVRLGVFYSSISMCLRLAKTHDEEGRQAGMMSLGMAIGRLLSFGGSLPHSLRRHHSAA